MTSQLHKKGEAWSARFSEPMSELVKRYTSSVFFDKRLAFVDIEGSLAHASMLAALSGSDSCAVFGPGTTDQAHSADEFVPVSDLDQAVRVLWSLATDCHPGLSRTNASA